jgi:hypothetical protein
MNATRFFAHYLLHARRNPPLGIARWKVYRATVVIMLVSVLIRIFALPMLGWKFHLSSFIVGMVFLPVLWELMGGIVAYLDRTMPFEQGVSRRIIAQISCFVLLYVVLTVALYYPVVWLFQTMLTPTEMALVFTRPFVSLAAITSLITIVSVNLGYFGHYFFTRWKAELVRSAELERERAQIQFDNLKNQLNPHFLFNALTSLNSLIFENQQLASDFVQHLAKVYRYILQSHNSEFVTLGRELSIVRHYVNLLKTRYASALQVEIRVHKEAEERLLVPLTVQSLVENAVKHNIINAEHPLCITISSIPDGDHWYLRVENTLQPKALVQHSNNQGLKNLQLLYRYITTRPIVIGEDTEHQRFVVHIPLL